MSAKCAFISLSLLLMTVSGWSSPARGKSSPWVGKTVVIQSFTEPVQYLGQRAMLCLMVDRSKPMDTRAVQYKIVRGLADPRRISFESVAHSGAYLGHWGFRLRLQLKSDDAVSRANATFEVVPGLGNEKGFSFVAFNYPGFFIAARDNGEVWITDNPKKEKATFNLVRLAK